MSQLWHDLRAKHVGGSEVAALFDESPYLTRFQLWNIKAGLIEPPNLDGDERMEAGKFLEDGIVQWANKKWNTHFERAGVYVKHATVEGMGCTPDALSPVDEAGTRILAQVKLVDWLEFRDKWQADRDVITNAPFHIVLQVQHELECAAIETGWLIVCVGGNSLYRMLVHRDEGVALILRLAVAEFWDTIRQNTPPDPEFARDGETIKQLRKILPPIPEIETDKVHFYRLLKARMKFSHRAKLATDELTKINAEIDHFMGNAQILRCRDITLKRQKNGALRLQSFEPIY